MINNNYNDNKHYPLFLETQSQLSSVDLYPFPFHPIPVKG